MTLLIRLTVLALLLAAAAALGLWRRRTDGRSRPVAQGLVVPMLGAVDRQSLGERATLLQFSSPVCGPCRAAQRVLAEVAARHDGVRHLELDAAENLELVRRLDVVRTPTVFVLDAAGRVLQRSAGVPTPAQVELALGTTAS